MTPARLQTIEEIFHAALDHEPDQVGAFQTRPASDVRWWNLDVGRFL
jgi:hypothetical protein